MFKTAVVIGGGAFGTSMASILANNFSRVILLVRSHDVYQGVKEKGINTVYLPQFTLSKKIIAANTWDEVDSLIQEKIELIVSGLPTQSMREYFGQHQQRIERYLSNGIPMVSLSKGIDADTLELPDDILAHHFPHQFDKILHLSGPSYAEEILTEQISMVSLAGRDKRLLEICGKMIDTEYFKVMYSYDVKGVLLGGALKNLLGIAGGIVEGLGFNHNTRAAMITRGINEMLRFGVVYNARPETFYGLSGMGDLILTVTGNLSRNKTFGIEISKGRRPEDIINSQRTVVEGYKTTLAAFKIAEKYDIRARMTRGLYSVLYENANPLLVIKNLMKVPSKFEVE